MTRTHKALLLAAVISLSGIAAWVLSGIKNSSEPEKTARPRPSKPNASVITSHQNSHGVKSGPKPGSVMRTARISATELEELKRKLAEYDAKLNGWISPEFKAFVESAVNRLLFTPEMLEMIELTRTKDLKLASTAFDLTLKKLLTDPAATAARRKLIEAVSDPRCATFAARWCLYAGEGCSKEEFESLAASLSDPVLVSRLEFGRNLTLVQTEPIAAVTSTLAYLKEPAARDFVFEILPEIARKLPPNSDFGEIERLLPAGGRKPDRELSYVREMLLAGWGASDPAAAANYVIANPERIPPEMMSSVLAYFARAHPAQALDWVQDFPPGPYFDAAASMVIIQIGENYPDTAKELAALIADPKSRTEALAEVESIRSRDAR